MEDERMENQVGRLISMLKDGKYWTERRDAAEGLAEVAKTALTAIEEVVKAEQDTDVRIACEQALNGVREHLAMEPAAVEPAPAAAEPSPASGPAAEETVPLAEIVQADIAGPNVEILETEGGYELVVAMESGRSQRLYVTEGRDETRGVDLIQVFTVCGPAHTGAFKWALEANSKLTHGAIALRTVSGREMFVVADSYPAAMVRREQVRDAVFAIAEVGDVIEKGLTRADNL